MKYIIGLLGIMAAWTIWAISSASASALGSTMPRCWSDEQPGIQDGIFLVDYATSGQTAQNFAQFLFSTQGIFATQQNVATESSLANVEVTFSAPDHPYQASEAFPTVEALKQYILADFARVAAAPGVTVRCAPMIQPMPALAR